MRKKRMQTFVLKLIRKTFLSVLIFLSARLIWMSFIGSPQPSVVEIELTNQEPDTEAVRNVLKSDWLLNFQAYKRLKNSNKTTTDESNSHTKQMTENHLSDNENTSSNTSIFNINSIHQRQQKGNRNSQTTTGSTATPDSNGHGVDKIKATHTPTVSVLGKPNIQTTTTSTFSKIKESPTEPKNVNKVTEINTTTIVLNTTISPVLSQNIASTVSYIKSTTQNKDRLNVTSGHGTVTERKDFQELFQKELSIGICDVVPVWGQSYHAETNTYDILNNVSYAMDSSGEYPIPASNMTGIETSDQESNRSEPLTVILVPFSHADPGYGLTIEQYYAKMTRKTLDLMVEKLFQYPNMTFQWAETVFLERWYRDCSSETKTKVKELIHRGQLEIVLGGWVMPDEASTTIVTDVDQLIEGHQWLQEHLGVSPKSAWVNDPFGYSSTMPYLWKSAGMDNLLFLRINQPVKAKLMERKSMDFLWRPYWMTSNSSDILATLMPYTNYWVSDVCGPNPDVCEKFNYLHVGNAKSKAVAVTDDNVAGLAKELYTQFRITGDLFKYNTLYMGLGEDFSYRAAKEWDDMFVNYQKLINYINNKDDWNMNIKFGTLTEYFNNVREEERKITTGDSGNDRSLTSTIPTLSGDFFPYTDRKGEFWTGYFSTRPLNKRFSREIESLLRAADIFNVIVHSVFKYYHVTYAASREISAALREARRELGMFMHHDGITGTSVPHVVRDYEKRLFRANTMAQTAMKSILVSILSKGKLHAAKTLTEEYTKPGTRAMATEQVLDTTAEVKAILINPTSKRRKEVVTYSVTYEYVKINSPVEYNIPFQTSTNGKQNTLSFEVELPAFGIEIFMFAPVKYSEVPEAPNIESIDDIDEIITIENMWMKVEFDKVTGLMKKIVHADENETKISSDFCVWQSKAGGAYIMHAASEAKQFSTRQRKVTVSKGPFMSEVRIASPGFLHTVRLYNTSGIQGHGIHVHTEVDMAAVGMKNMDVILKIHTDIENKNNFYTDQNNFHLIGRKNTLSSIPGSFFPMTSMVLIEDDLKRLTVHSKQPHGVTSVNRSIEVMLDRHTFHDDGRGLGQGVYDNVKVNADFILHIEHKDRPFEPVELRYTFPTQDAVLMNDFLQNNVMTYIQIDKSANLVSKVHAMKESQFPCDISIVGFRNLVTENLEYNTTSLVLHRRSLHCGFKTMNDQCISRDAPLTIKSIFPKLKVGISETSLSLVHTKETLKLDSDIKPNKDELRTFRIKI